MGEAAVQTLLKRIEAPTNPYPEVILFEPELMIRESTTTPNASTAPNSRTRQKPLT